ncbi:MAG: signal peptidase II [Erysipelotrichaceae bacterium]|nr:signal peptidase II [Erysipelotrichaceae bacterium]
MLYLFYFTVVFGLVAFDQLSKYYIVANIPLNSAIDIIPGFFKVTYVQNFGAGFSILQNQNTLFLIITPIAIIFLCYLLFKTKKGDLLTISGLLLMIAGALGNFIDRIFTVYVVDFLDFVIFGYDFPVFNIADSFLTIGVFLFIIAILKEKDNA